MARYLRHRLVMAQSSTSRSLKQTYVGLLVVTLLAIGAIAIWMRAEPGDGVTERRLSGTLAFVALFTVLDVLILIPIGRWIFGFQVRSGEAMWSVVRVLGGLILFGLAAAGVIALMFVTCLALGAIA